MLSLLANSPLHVADSAILAAPSLNISWAIVLFAIILGLMVTLSPSRRTQEVKRPKDA